MDTLIKQEFEDNIDNDYIYSNSDNSEHMNDNLNIIPNEVNKLHCENKELRSGKPDMIQLEITYLIILFQLRILS